jgi:hypothetical protein
VLAVSGCGEDAVHAYCNYGSVSEAQLEGCIGHVSTKDIARLNTAAARFARNPEGVGCRGSRVGPFCRRYLQNR